MKTLDWVLLSLPLVLIWVPAVLFVGSDLRRLYRDWRDRRRLERYMRDQAWAYRELNLSEPLGRPRLGMNKEED
jgi:hypothetical protein